MEFIKGINLFNGLSSLPNKKRSQNHQLHLKPRKNSKKKNIIYPRINPSQITKEFPSKFKTVIPKRNP